MAKKSKPAQWKILEGGKSEQEAAMLEVKAFPLWESESGERKLLGYYPGIYGPNRWGSYVFLLPAFPQINLDNTLAWPPYFTPEEAMSHWENSAPTDAPVPYLFNTVSEEVRRRIAAMGLYRDPYRTRVANPFEEEAEENTEEEEEHLALL